MKKKIKTAIMASVIAIVLGLVGYIMLGSMPYGSTTESKPSIITSEEHVNKTTSNLTESLRNISETLNEIENILKG
jgi:ABC-type lipoprotein release transport system permease subunit